jgi:hypothetical protein
MNCTSSKPEAIAARLAKGVTYVLTHNLTITLAAKRARCNAKHLGRHLRSIGIITKAMGKNKPKERQQ